ncbi:MAG: alpha/beta hydrolase, partial [Spirochaetales bacterium]|nr:alpha/beta hydrolase [Candidatus Physcosoma equi]
MYVHGGADMLEQGSSYAVELARRGYVVVTFDYSGAHNSDVPTGTAETAVKEGGSAPMGLDTVFNALKLFNFVDKDRIITMGHSMGGSYTAGFAVDHQDEIFLQVNIGMNMWGSAKVTRRDYNFVNILGDSDESTLARTNNNVVNTFANEQLVRIFTNDYETAKEKLSPIELGKVYHVKGSAGQDFVRIGLMPDSCHAYYLVDNDAIRAVVFGVTYVTGQGLDAGVNSYADVNKIKLVWAWKDFGYILQLAATVVAMVTMASWLLDTSFFSTLQLEKTAKVGIYRKEKPVYYWIFFAVLFVLPVALFRKGILSSRSFLGINISNIWLLGGNNNAYISWQWLTSIGMIVIFLAYHFLWGKKHGGNLQTYGFRTSNDGAFKCSYILKSLLYGLFAVGCGYLVFAFISAYTKQGMHIATFMMATLNVNRTFCVFMYVLFQIPYFLCSSLALKSVGVGETEDNAKGTLKSILIGTVLTVLGLLLLWTFFVYMVNVKNTVTTTTYFSADRVYIYTIAILPLFIGMTIANTLNMVVSKKTNSIWPGFFTALLWGAWMICACCPMAKYLY